MDLSNPYHPFSLGCSGQFIFGSITHEPEYIWPGYVSFTILLSFNPVTNLTRVDIELRLLCPLRGLKTQYGIYPRGMK